MEDEGWIGVGILYVIRCRVHNRVSEIGCSVYSAGGEITMLTVEVSEGYGGTTGDSECFD